MSKAIAIEKKSNTPVLIIVGVLVLAALGGAHFVRSSIASRIMEIHCRVADHIAA